MFSCVCVAVVRRALATEQDRGKGQRERCGVARQRASSLDAPLLDARFLQPPRFVLCSVVAQLLRRFRRPVGVTATMGEGCAWG